MINTQTLEIGDSVVHVCGEGVPLVFVHGFTTTAEFWREQTQAFSSDYKVIRINLPGHGVSPSPVERDYTIAAFVDDVAKVYRALELKTSILVGLSMGGTIAQTFALRYPELVRTLVLVGATPHGLGPDVNVDNVLNAIRDMGVIAASKQVIERSFGSAASPDLVAFAQEEVTHTPAHVACKAIMSLNEADTRSRLADIRVPTLVVVGEEDAITPPEQSRLLADGISNAQLEIIPAAAHFPMLEQPESFNSILATFLKHVPVK